MHFPSRWLYPTLLLALLPALEADPSIKVDVVMDFTPAGKNLPVATAEQPVYYVPVPYGLEDLGPNVGYYRTPPPPKEQTEHTIAVMLANQHYYLTARNTRPTLILVFKWGFKSPNVMKVSRDDHYRAQGPTASRMGHGINSPSMSSTADLMPEIAGSFYTDPNQGAMEDLVGGRLVNFKSIQNDTDERSRQLGDMTRYARWYVQITALDYQAWLNHKEVSLWREYMSTDLWGHNFGDILPTLVTTGGYFVGREMSEPAIMSESIVAPQGWSYIGKPVVVPEKKKAPKSVWDY